MNRKKIFCRRNEARQLLFKKNQFVILLCVGLIAIVVFSTINIQSASADIMKNAIYKTPKDPPMPMNYTEIQYCDNCHYSDSDIWISVTVDSQTQSDITYYVTGSSEKFEGIEGWAVFDKLENNKVHGHFSGYFTLPKDGDTYRVFWVDNGTKDPPDPENPGGSAYTDITTPNDPPTPPTITGPKSGSAGTSYDYDFVSTDSEGDKIFYYIEWGDGTKEDWFGPFPSGQKQTKSHTWTEQDTYIIKAKARDEHGAESDESQYEVTMPRNRVFPTNTFIQKIFFGQFPNSYQIIKQLLGL